MNAVLSFSEAMAKADEWCSKYIRLRDALYTTGTPTHCRCITCRKIKPLQEFHNGHYIDRASKALRYDERNCNAQCSECNMDRVNKGIIHESYGYAIDRKFGPGTKESLRKKRLSEPRLFSAVELTELAHDFHKKYFNLTQNGKKTNRTNPASTA